jgi:hypothetical protein
MNAELEEIHSRVYSQYDFRCADFDKIRSCLKPLCVGILYLFLSKVDRKCRKHEQSLLTLQRGVTSTARHSVNITCRGVTSPARHAARSHSFVYISTS